MEDGKGLTRRQTKGLLDVTGPLKEWRCDSISSSARYRPYPLQAAVRLILQLYKSTQKTAKMCTEILLINDACWWE